MILSRNIPLTVQRFLLNLQRDFNAGLHASDYRELLIRETRARYPGFVEGLADYGRGRTSRGQVRIVADADHIIPKSVWKLLIPVAWSLPGPAPETPNILSNLFWRTVTCNRGAVTRGEALDLPWILQIKSEAKTQSSPKWANLWIRMFLQTKHDEGVNIDVPVHPGRADEMVGLHDLGDIYAFIQHARDEHPGITPAQLIDLVENRFPHIRIETNGIVEIG